VLRYRVVFHACLFQAGRSLAPAPLADAGVTSFRAASRAAEQLGSGDATLVVGAGGLGQFAIQWLRYLADAKVAALDINRPGWDELWA
jgi:propanol-preferring alcohol dehydrogenase